MCYDPLRFILSFCLFTGWKQLRAVCVPAGSVTRPSQSCWPVAMAVSRGRVAMAVSHWWLGHNCGCVIMAAGSQWWLRHKAASTTCGCVATTGGWVATNGNDRATNGVCVANNIGDAATNGACFAINGGDAASALRSCPRCNTCLSRLRRPALKEDL